MTVIKAKLNFSTTSGTDFIEQILGKKYIGCFSLFVLDL